MDYDIIIYAVIAVIVLAKLWSVLGQRGQDDRERPNPFAVPPSAPDTTTPVIKGRPAGDIPLLPKPLEHAPASLAGGLAQIKTADPRFDEKQFLQWARTTFTKILSDFSKGDLAETTLLLGPNVLPHFRAAIEARRAALQVMENKLIAIREAECVTAKLDETQAVITVRFVSEQQHTLRDAQGQVIAGGDNQSEEITDLWTFARETKSTDPNWQLIETRS